MSLFQCPAGLKTTRIPLLCLSVHSAVVQGCGELTSKCRAASYVQSEEERDRSAAAVGGGKSQPMRKNFLRLLVVAQVCFTF